METRDYTAECSFVTAGKFGGGNMNSCFVVATEEFLVHKKVWNVNIAFNILAVRIRDDVFTRTVDCVWYRRSPHVDLCHIVLDIESRCGM
ncbi:hypothetical protein NPIL_205121 [Nephila pilipes]|uniref:Uncharacterized protein n=1 Tax=Nephila pilipes TaxID=299642 RepID=A0A8X6URG5_NEPPI|nr:hypothetical protein NPIL_205121 [Nephila pilipes]